MSNGADGIEFEQPDLDVIASINFKFTTNIDAQYFDQYRWSNISPHYVVHFLQALVKERLGWLSAQLSQNAYFQYKQSGTKPLLGDRPDWQAKDEYIFLEARIFNLQELASAVAAKWPDTSHQDPGERNRKQIARALIDIWSCLRQTKASSTRRVEIELSEQDSDLCLLWSGNHQTHFGEVRTLINVLGYYEAARLSSARAAELAAAEYYRALDFMVEDVSILQLGGVDRRWKDFDLFVDSRPIDVKNARRSFSNPDTYVEHCVPKFKSDRQTGKEVVIVGVLSNSVKVDPLFQEIRTDALVLGELRDSEFENLLGWLQVRFGDVIDYAATKEASFHPGWQFEYPPEHYPGHSSARAHVQNVMSLLDVGGLEPCEIPLWFLPLAAANQSLEKLQLPATKATIAQDIRSIESGPGISRPALYLYVMSAFLKMMSQQRATDALAKALDEMLFVGHIKTSRDQYPVGLEDPQRYVFCLIAAMQQIGAAVHRQGRKLTSFALRHPAILKGRLENGEWITLLAYCGGWFQSKYKCGTIPLVYGTHSLCEECSHLICSRCDYCSHNCSFSQNRIFTSSNIE